MPAGIDTQQSAPGASGGRAVAGSNPVFPISRKPRVYRGFRRSSAVPLVPAVEQSWNKNRLLLALPRMAAGQAPAVVEVGADRTSSAVSAELIRFADQTDQASQAKSDQRP